MQHPLKRKSAAAATSACGRSARRSTYTSKEGINKLVDILRLIIATRSQQFHVTGRPDRHGNARERGKGRKVEELQSGWPSPQILIFWFTGSCPSFLSFADLTTYASLAILSLSFSVPAASNPYALVSPLTSEAFTSSILVVEFFYLKSNMCSKKIAFAIYCEI